MSKTILYWTYTLIVLFALGPLAASLVGNLHAADGSSHVTPFTSITVLRGILGGLGVLTVATIAGLIGATAFHVRDGLTFAGLVVAWAAFRTGSPDAILRNTQNTATLWAFAREGALFGLAGTAVCLIIGLLHREDPAPAANNRAASLNSDDQDSFPARAIALAAASIVGALVGGALAWVIAVETLKLQTLAATIAAGVGAGAACQLVLTVMPRARVTFLRTLLAGALAMAFLAVVGPISALAVERTSAAVLRSAYDGNYFGLAAPLAFDWVAGALIGLPLGLAWSSSLIDQRQGT